MSEIDLVPDLFKYPHIRAAKEKGKLIVFLGAGLSALWGCNRWKEMAAALIEACYTRRKISYWEKESLINKYSGTPRRLITIAREILADEYLPELKKSLSIDGDRQKEMPELLKHLLGFDAIYMTTNVDGHLAALFSKECNHVNPDDFNIANLKPGHLFHLHGTFDDPSSLVLTIDQYINRYNDTHFHEFLASVFTDESFCFLFIGYGLDELELIDFIIVKHKEAKLPSERLIDRLYMLLPFFQNESSLLQYERKYFDKFRMTVIPFAIDARGHDQLYAVLETWRQGFEKPVRYYESSSLLEEQL